MDHNCNFGAHSVTATSNVVLMTEYGFNISVFQANQDLRDPKGKPQVVGAFEDFCRQTASPGCGGLVNI